MADSHPFSNAGLGMFGSAERSFAGSAMANRFAGDGKGDDGNPLGTIATWIANQFASKPSQYSINGSVPAPETSLPPVSVMPQGISPPGINPVSPSGVGINPNMQPKGLNSFGNNPLQPIVSGQQPSATSMQYDPVTHQVWGKP